MQGGRAEARHGPKLLGTLTSMGQQCLCLPMTLLIQEGVDPALTSRPGCVLTSLGLQGRIS